MTMTESPYLAAIRADHGHGARSASGEIVTAWTYKPDGHAIAAGQSDNSGLSGHSPVGPAMVAHELREHGHVILTAGSRPARHHVIGDGPGHDDAQFCEAGISFADYCESGRAFDGSWWTWDTGKLGRWFEVLRTDERSHLACCAVDGCLYCAALRERVSQLIPAPVEHCPCGRYSGRDLAHLADGSPECFACRMPELFGA